MGEGWICPVCRGGVAPAVDRCPCVTAPADSGDVLGVAPGVAGAHRESGPAHARHVCEHCGSAAPWPHDPGCPRCGIGDSSCVTLPYGGEAMTGGEPPSV